MIIKRVIRNWHYRHSYLIWINDWVIHACPKPEDFIENKHRSPSIFISVSRQESGNLHILHQVVTFTKRGHDIKNPSQLVQPEIWPVSKSTRAYVPGVVQYWMCAALTFRLFTCRMYLFIPVVYGGILTLMSCRGCHLNILCMTNVTQLRSQ